MIANEQHGPQICFDADVSVNELAALYASVLVNFTPETLWHITVASAALQAAFMQQHEGNC